MPKKNESIFFSDDFHNDTLEQDFYETLEYILVKDKKTVIEHDTFIGLAMAIRHRLIKKWLRTQNEYRKQDTKRVYYLSLEFLMGRLMGNTLINMDFYRECSDILSSLGYNLEDIRDLEPDMGLGNGGLGRLAACFLDSMATLELPAFGYGIRYEYGIFKQGIKDGWQVESPDNWLRYGNPWEIVRPEHEYRIKFKGKIVSEKDENDTIIYKWVDTEDVLALAYDVPIPGYSNNTVNNLRLWQANATDEFDFNYFNQGDYIAAVENKNSSENISKVLYPNDNVHSGKILRLQQQYFFVSASLQDIIEEYHTNHENFDRFSEKVAVQLNDTHPTIAIPELMRILVDEEGLTWGTAWNITKKTFAYTNHTVLPEALEKWPISMLEEYLPRHVQIIFEINKRFLQEVREFFNYDLSKIRSLSLVDEDYPKQIRMAHLAIVGSHKVNGVSALHTQILKDDIFNDFYKMYPDKFINMTNGVTQRRWLKKANIFLSNLISDKIGDGWVKNLDELKKIEKLADNKSFQNVWQEAKWLAKKHLMRYVKNNYNIDLNPSSIFDVQVKRIHEYMYRMKVSICHQSTHPFFLLQ